MLTTEQCLFLKKTSKRKIFIEEEDAYLTRSFVNSNQDLIKVSGQKGKAFWNRVKKGFEILCPPNSTDWEAY